MERQIPQLSITERNKIRQNESKKIFELGHVVAITRASVHFVTDLDKAENNYDEKAACALKTKNATLELFTDEKTPRNVRVNLIMQTQNICQEILKKINPKNDEEVFKSRKISLVHRITENNLANEDMANKVADLMLGRSDILNISNFELVREMEEKSLIRKV
jgi:hypothetical protein